MEAGNNLGHPETDATLGMQRTDSGGSNRMNWEMGELRVAQRSLVMR